MIYHTTSCNLVLMCVNSEHSEVATTAFARSTCTTHIFNLLEAAVDKRTAVPHALLGHASMLSFDSVMLYLP
jgi:hypothetical protein